MAVFGLLDAGFWLVGFPTMLSPAWALLSNVIYDLSLILYLRIAGVGRVLGRLFRRARSSTASKIRTARENMASRVHRSRRLGRVVKPMMVIHHELAKSVITLSNSLRIRHPAWRRLRRYLPDYRDPSPLARPVSAFMEDASAYLGSRATLYSESGRRGLARLTIAGAGLASFILEYPRFRSLGERGGRLHEIVKLKFRRGGVEVDFRAYSHGGEVRSDSPTHLLTKSLSRRLSVKETVRASSEH
ncbi:hypothetical protein [Vulcanisaeta distributa]|uniref:hypothetical protein n=1 Tax=Vulcanisaeta distributa TaxID=164451 RepID=UPI001FB45C6D|nr:hypothetical protein [Vulcanisaeta distributa]